MTAGIAGAGGVVVALVSGAVGIGVGLLAAVAAAIAIGALLLGAAAASSRLAPPSVGTAGSVVGAIGVVKEARGATGQVLVEGARWQAQSTEPLEAGMRVQVVAVDGLLVTVTPVDPA